MARDVNGPETPLEREGFRQRVRRTARVVAIGYARIALGVGFLSAVADRFGVWGPPGTRNVAWGDFSHFLQYTATLNPLLPARFVRPLGWFVTVCEVVFGIALLAGIAVREVAFLSGVLLFAFAAGMSIGTGVKTALDASVFAASAGAFLLALGADVCEA
ncbi:MAG: DoxX protein [Betaproteobacteria bacterium]